MNIETQIQEEIVRELDELKRMEVGTDQYKVTVDGLTKLADRAIEIDKLNVETDNKAKDRENDEKLKIRQMDEDKQDRFIRNVIAAGGILLPLAVTIWGTVKTIEFEKEGTFTTIMGRGFINKLLPKK